MKINFKFYNYKRVYINFCFLALLIIFFSTEKIYAKTFSVNHVEISSPFEINFDKNDIIDKGFSLAFDQLILSIIQTKEQKKLENISLSIIKGMIETFSIHEEKFINDIYYLSLNVSFNKKKIFNLLESKNIFPSLPIDKKVFFIPLIVDNSKNEILMFSESYLFKNWNSKISKHHLLKYILPTEDLEDFNLIKSNLENIENYDFKEIIEKYNLENFIITIVFKNNYEIRVLNKISFNEKMYIKNLRFKNLKLNDKNEIQEFIQTLKNIYENQWKYENEINTSIKSFFTVSAKNNDSNKISQFEELLTNMDLIYNFYIYKFNNKDNFYKIIFNGSPDYFIKIMKNKDYELDIQNQIWAIK